MIILRRPTLGLVSQLPRKVRDEALPPGLLRRLPGPQRLLGVRAVALLVDGTLDSAHEAVEAWPAEDLGVRQ